MNPVNAPYKLIVWLLTAVAHHGILITRVVAASFGILAVLTFYAIIRPWYNFRSAFLGTLLFATSAGFLHSARLGTGQILQMGILVYIGAILWYQRKQSHRIPIGYGVAALLASLLYVPGMIWFELFGLILLNRGVRHQLRQVERIHLAGWGSLFVIIIIPLVLAGIKKPQLLLSISGLPPTIHALSNIASNALNTVMSAGVRSNGNPLLWVGHAPLLNITELILGIIGGYYYLYRERSRRTIFLVGSTVLCMVLISFGGSVGFACLVPFAYLFIASGLDHLLDQWLSVFPRNPIARSTGVGLICIMLFFSVLYQVRSYYVAWPHHAATRETFQLQQP